MSESLHNSPLLCCVKHFQTLKLEICSVRKTMKAFKPTLLPCDWTPVLVNFSLQVKAGLFFLQSSWANNVFFFFFFFFLNKSKEQWHFVTHEKLCKIWIWGSTNKVLLQPTQAPSSCSIYDFVHAPRAELSEHNRDRRAQDISGL